jgi:hypothetical protein
MSLSLYNSTIVSLESDDIFLGQEYDNILDFVEINISVKCDTGFSITYIYSQDKLTVDYETTQAITASVDTHFFTVPVKNRYFKLRIEATDGNMSVLNVQTIYKTSITYDPPNDAPATAVDVMNFPTGFDCNNLTDLSGVNVSANISNPYITTRIQGSGGEYLAGNAGALICEARNYSGNGNPISATNAALHTFITNPTAIPVSCDISGQTVNIGTLPDLNGLVVDISGQTVDISGQTVNISGQTVNISGQTVDISGQTVALASGTIPHLNFNDDSILDSGVYKPTDDGVNSYFEITATPVNNVSTYYADETQGVDASGGGWQFTSALHSGGLKRTKINWYMYQPKTDVVIGDLTSINATNTYYTIITNVGVEFPMIYIYTKPTVPATKTTGGVAGSSWYQSRFVYQATQAGTAGTYLLYVGKDPDIYTNPLIPRIKLTQLDSLCAGTLQTNEIVMSASLQTSSALVSPNGNFSLTMFKFGVIIDPVNTPIKVDANGSLNVVIQNSAAIQVNSNTRDGAGNSITSTSSALDVNIKNSPLIVKDKPTSSVSLTDLSGTSQLIRNSAGCLNSFYIANISGAGTHSCYVKFYNSSTAVAGDVSLMTIVLHKDTQVYINSSNMNFSNALCVRAVNAFSDASADSAIGTTSIICFLSDYSA